MTLKTQLMHLSNIIYHRFNTKKISRYMLCLSLNFELIKRPDPASKFPKWGSRKEKIHLSSYCSKRDKHVGNFQLLYDIAQRMRTTPNEKCRPIIRYLFNLQTRFWEIFRYFSFFTIFFCYYLVQMTLQKDSCILLTLLTTVLINTMILGICCPYFWTVH